MDTPNQFHKMLQQIMSRPPKHNYTAAEIHFDVLAMEVLELVGDRWVVWMN
jgi:hypothetical protein